ncbi:MAG: acyl-CoA dehydrogenase family protein [Gemmataceae bacterium]
MLEELGGAGYWGLLIDPKYGGQGAVPRSPVPHPHGHAGPDARRAGVDSRLHRRRRSGPHLRHRRAEGTALAALASGERLSGFALTEPAAGSDLTALRTTARLDGDDYVVNGEKLFITNVIPGRTAAVVVLIDKKPAVLIVDLPDRENDSFRLVPYGLYALRHAFNNGIIFRDFRVPRNLLTPTVGDGLTIAYHGLNRAGCRCAQRCRDDADDARQPPAVGRVSRYLRSANRPPRAGQAAASPGWPG